MSMPNNNTSTASQEERVEDIEEELDLPPSPSVRNNEDSIGTLAAATGDTTLSPPRPGPDLIDDGVGPMPPFPAMAALMETTKGAGGSNPDNQRRPAGVEQIDAAIGSEFEEGPQPPVHMDSRFDDYASKEMPRNNQNFSSAPEGQNMFSDIPEPNVMKPPTPSNTLAYERKVADSASTAQPTVTGMSPGSDGVATNRDTLCIPTREEIEGEAEPILTIRPTARVRVNKLAAPTYSPDNDLVNEPSANNANQRNNYFAPGTRNENGGVGEELSENDADHNDRTVDPNEHDDLEEQRRVPFRRESSSIPGITEAYAVDDNIVIATPTEPPKPWWKQRRTKILLVIIIVLIVAVFAIALGVSLSSTSTNTTELVALRFSAPPSVSLVPTYGPTTGRPSLPPSNFPSSSLIPSSSPSSCAYTISTNMQELKLLHPDSYDTKIAIDGRNVVIASRIVPESSSVSRGSFYVVFYSLTDSNGWQKVGEFIEGGIDWSFRGHRNCEVALSGDTAVIGLPSYNYQGIEQTLYIFKQNDIGSWERISAGSPRQSNPVSDCGFGLSTELDGNLIATSDDGVCGMNLGPNAAYLFQKVEGNWEEVEFLSNETEWVSNVNIAALDQVSIAGDTIATKWTSSCYIHDDPFYQSCFIHVYKFDQENNDIFMSDSIQGERCGPMELWGDHLVYSADDGVQVYKRDTEDEPLEFLQYFNSSDYGEGFGITLAMDKGILVVGSHNHSYIFSQQSDGIWDEALSFDESFYHYQMSGRNLIVANEKEVYAMDIADCTQPAPTQTPSVSLSPTKCYQVEFDFSRFEADDWKATLEMIESDIEVVKSWKGDFDGRGYNDALCLREGQYKFTMLAVPFGYEIMSVQQYRVASNGLVIDEESVDLSYHKEFGQITAFDIPYDPTTATTTRLSATPSPTATLEPSSPTVSPTPFPTILYPTFSPILYPTYSPEITPRPSHPTTPFPTETIRRTLRNASAAPAAAAQDAVTVPSDANDDIGNPLS